MALGPTGLRRALDARAPADTSAMGSGTKNLQGIQPVGSAPRDSEVQPAFRLISTSPISQENWSEILCVAAASFRSDFLGNCALYPHPHQLTIFPCQAACAPRA